MGRRSLKDRLRAIDQELLECFSVTIGLGSDRVDLVAGLTSYLELHDAWDRGDLKTLPSTDVEGTVLSTAELVGVAHVTDFVLRRSVDGFDSSRPVTVDALRLVKRTSGSIDVILALVGDAQTLPTKLVNPIDDLCDAEFTLCRYLIAHFLTHPCPDVDAGRDDPDAWLPLAESARVRKELLALVVRSHQLQRRLPKRMSTADWLITQAVQCAQRLTCHLQIASVDSEDGNVITTARAQPTWFTPSEVQACLDILGRALELPKSELTSQIAFARNVLSITEQQNSGSLKALIVEAAEDPLITTRNRVPLLRTLLEMASDPSEVEVLIDRLFVAVDDLPAAEGLRLRAGALPSVLVAIGRVAVSDPRLAVTLLKRSTGLDPGEVLRGPDVWLVPSFPPVCLLCIDDDNPETIEIRGLAPGPLLERLVVDYAEEFERTVESRDLRKELTAALEPLRSPLAGAKRSLSVHAFGHLKHVPLAAITGRGALLARRPGLRIWSPGRDGAQPARKNNRLWIVDDDLAQSRRLPLGADQVHRFDSSLPILDPAAEPAFLSLQSGGVGELFFFGHGHVDQFRNAHTGLVIQHGDPRRLVLSALQFLQFDLSEVQVAVVMACGAGQGNVFVEPSLSVSHALRRAGVHRVIAPIWPIMAEDAFKFITRYTHHLALGEQYETAWAATLAESPNRYMSIGYFGD